MINPSLNSFWRIGKIIEYFPNTNIYSVGVNGEEFRFSEWELCLLSKCRPKSFYEMSKIKGNNTKEIKEDKDMSKFNKGDSVIVVSDCQSYGLIGIVQSHHEWEDRIPVDLENGKTVRFSKSSLKLSNPAPKTSKTNMQCGVLFYNKSCAEEYVENEIFAEVDEIFSVFMAESLEKCLSKVKELERDYSLDEGEEYYLVFDGKVHTFEVVRSTELKLVGN